MKSHNQELPDATAGLFAELARVQADSLKLHCAAMIAARGNQLVPVLHVDASNRPDVADMPRAVMAEGAGGPAMVGWQFAFFDRDAEGVMNISIDSPVRCRFSVAISARQHAVVLRQILAAGKVVVITSCPMLGRRIPPFAVLTVCQSNLVRMALGRIAKTCEP